MDYNSNSYYPGQDPQEPYRPKPKRPASGRLKKLLWIVPLVLFLLAAVFDSFYTLK